MATIDLEKIVRNIAESNGIEAEKALKIAADVAKDEKCMDMVAYYKPYGGATSFSEVDNHKEVAEYAMKVDTETFTLRGIIDNITTNDDMDTDGKAKAIADAASDYRNRINTIEPVRENKSLWEKVKSILESGDKHKHRPIKGDTSLPEIGGFKIYRDRQGDLRWLSLSSNAYEDIEKELFTTKALEEAVEHADKTDERGPLLVYHVPSAEIGQCDFQAMAGRFLIESGTFDDTPLGQKAVEYFVNSDEEHQVSIGYRYRSGDELDGQYDWVRILERSVCPHGAAANPWTDFKVIGEKPLDANKAAMMEKVFGKDLAVQVITAAEDKTKELDQTVKHKTLSLTLEGASVEELEKAFEDAKKTLADSKKEEGDEKADEPEASPESEEESEDVSFDKGQLTELASLIATQVNDLNTIKETMVAVQEEIKALKASDDEKLGEIIKPRWNLNTVQRPSESDSNVIKDEKTVKELTNEILEDQVNPAKKYLDDLFQARVGT